MTSPEPEPELLSAWTELLPGADSGRDFFENGGDSLTALLLIDLLRRRGWQVKLQDVIEHPDLGSLASRMVRFTDAEPTLTQGPVPLSPAQVRILSPVVQSRHHYNVAQMYSCATKCTPEAWTATVARLTSGADALWTRFVPTDPGWQATTGAPEPQRVAHFEVVPSADDGEQAAFLEERCTHFQLSLDLERGPLARFVYFDRGPGKDDRVFLVIHHLVCDAVAMDLLAHRLADALKAGSEGTAATADVVWPPHRSWAEEMDAWAQDPDAWQADAGHWVAVLSGAAQEPTYQSPERHRARDASRGLCTMRSPAGASQTVSADRASPGAGPAHARELLGVYACALAHLTGSANLVIDVTGHGRDQEIVATQVGGVLGSLYTTFPVRIRWDGGDDLAGAKAAASVSLGRFARRGAGFELLRNGRHHPSDLAELRAMPGAQFRFNYMGGDDGSPAYGPLRAVNEPIGRSFPATNAPRYALELMAYLDRDRRTELTFAYDESQLTEETLRAFMARMASLLGWGGKTS